MRESRRLLGNKTGNARFQRAVPHKKTYLLYFSSQGFYIAQQFLLASLQRQALGTEVRFEFVEPPLLVEFER